MILNMKVASRGISKMSFYLFFRFSLFLFLFCFTSCAKFTYLVEQGKGQWKIQSEGVNNQEILQRESVPELKKEKIRQIEDFKSFFYQYFQMPLTAIYSKTTILESENVSWMVVVSRVDKIESLEECFLVAGCFPYLSFFKKEKALEYQSEKKRLGYDTSLRPIYAYSTLGYLEDRILSSFFYFGRIDLGELVFHELFHTIFFIKNEVKLNENLATYFASQLVPIYFQKEQSILKEWKAKEGKEKILRKYIAGKVKELQDLYTQLNQNQQDRPLDLENYRRTQQEFLEKNFQPGFKKKCHELGLAEKKCPYLNEKWNNASFSLFLTYEDHLDKISQLHHTQEGDLPEFHKYLQNKYDEYKKRHEETSFETFLLKSAPLLNAPLPGARP
jgi:predicted aminopeptidase